MDANTIFLRDSEDNIIDELLFHRRFCICLELIIVVRLFLISAALVVIVFVIIVKIIPS